METKKGQKRIKNIPVLHDEVKERHQIVVTPTAWKNLKHEASIRNLSISELIEEFGRALECTTSLPHA